MKSIIVGVLVFLLALGGASFFSISKAKSAAAVQMAEAAAADSLAAGDADGDDTEGPQREAGGESSESDSEGGPAGEGAAEGDSVQGDPAPPATGEGGAQFASTTLPDAGSEDADEGPSVPASELGGTDPAGDLNPEGIRRMARIFTAMKPKDAAAVLERMTDAEVQGVMLQMGDRAAAGILSVFDPERAAALSQIVLGRREAP